MSVRAEFGIGLGVVAGVTVLGAIWWQRSGKTLLTETLNPASTDNAVYQAVSAPADGSLGARIWEWFHPSDVQQEKAVTGGAVKPPGDRQTAQIDFSWMAW